MKLLTKALEHKLRKQHDERRDDLDNLPIVKLFCPWGSATWLLSELESDLDRAFGLCDLGLGFPELGYVSLNELGNLKGPGGLGIERDLYFEPNKSLLEYNRAAQETKCIIA